ncbi:beta strand repeat-containing protein [Deinococcus aerophilus]|uniref:Ig-like domain-containing protein n=1 Tax=Deinococcus aerophilus TaxID=522488 RepID=A0ABQ2GKJ0_9DEIO|nr:Ig-like domain-containing protein [Deinococcus aerophilus]GGL99895.1 hypothetical protein GCM10010841_05620 [Deinococcus aerophilus]
MKIVPRNPILLLLTGTLVACGGGSTPSTPGNNAPTVNIKAGGRAITPDTYLPSRGRLDVSVSDPDIGGSIKKVSYSIDNGAKIELTPAASITLPLPALTGGQHEVAVEATDNAGAVTTIKAPFLIDAAAPTLNTMNLNGQVAAETATLTVGDAALLSVTAQDTRGDTENTPGPVIIRVLESGTLVKSVSGSTMTVDLTKAPSNTARTAGTVIFTVEAQDSVGFVTSRNIAVTFNAASTGDNGGVTAPTFTWLSPASDFVKGGGSVTLRATATRNGQDLSSQIIYTATCGTIAGNIWTLGADCADGSKQSVTATVTDGGRSFSSPAKVITVDASDPTVQIISPQQGQSFTQNPIKISVTGTDAVSGLDRILVEASKDGISYTQVGVVTAASGDVTWAPMSGTYTLRATATDKTGRTSTTTLSGIKVNLTSSDATPPTGNINAPAGDIKGQVALTVTAFDTTTVTDAASGVATVSLYIDGLLSGTQTTGVNRTYTFPTDTTKLSEGNHVVKAVITDNAGNTFTTSEAIVRVNNAAPTVTISNPANGALLGSTSDATVKATATDTTPSDTVTREYSVDGSAFTATVPTLPKTDGTHTVTVRATDTAGNTGTATSTYTYDGTAPTVQITSPTQGQMFTSTPVTINVIGQDSGTGVASVKVYANDGSGEELIGTLGGNGSVTWFPRKTDGTPYIITARATDRAGNASADATVSGVKVQTASTVTIANDPSITVPSANPKGAKFTDSGLAYVRGPLVVSATATTTAPSFSLADLQVDGQTRSSLTAPAAQPTFNFDFDTLNEGLHDVGVRFTDSLGTVGIAKTTVFVDKTAPVITWNTPSLTKAAVDLNATAIDAASSANVTIPVTYSENGKSVAGPITGDGQHTVTANAVDNVGNVGTRTVTFTIDSTDPDIVPALPDDQTNPQQFTTAPITLAATATDATTSVTSIEVLVGLQGQTLTTLGRQNGSSYSAVFTPSVAGDYTVQYIARDAAGNSSTVKRNFRYSAPVEKAPDPKLSVVGGAPYSGNMSVNVSGNYDSLSQVDRTILQITDAKGIIDNSTYVTTQSQATFSIDTTKLANGIAKLSLIAYTKSGLRSISPVTEAEIKNVLKPVLAIAAPSDGAAVTTPSVPVRVTLTRSGDTNFTFTPATVNVDLMDYRGQLIQQKVVSCAASVDAATYTCDTTFDIASLPADTYTVRASAQVTVEGTVQPLSVISRFTSNTVSVNPPAATISFPTAVTLTGGTRVPARIDSGSGFFATVSDNTSIQYVEARIVGPYAEGNIETDGTRQCQASGSIVSGESELNILVLNIPGAALLPYQTQDVFVPKLDIDGSTYVPDSKTGQRYDLRVTTADAEGNRNIQCVPVKVERGLTRPGYTVSTSTSPDAPSPTPGELTFTSGVWTLNNVPANSRVIAVYFANGKQVGTDFFAKTSGAPIRVSQNFSDVGTYSVSWLIEDMSTTAGGSTGVVTSQSGGFINVARNPK